ncbi:GAF and ANTAR domain-containing protein [Actinacidiphila sp. DG2A-62]|uniref:GAF and ANTAR domain-containing protein n=1 Tax=Actinacidiphila sp. DG2A-62 TaxID=3108821 RepID=UPI002DB7B0E2|nr:GAF and ANTAR domain-containing protein [Actinacidiphila sp. DG2A-62]MEC3998434.1 GAF and ANTAR domain-containing protein [Actinacidiphila sp. DG2A-62]
MAEQPPPESAASATSVARTPRGAPASAPPPGRPGSASGGVGARTELVRLPVPVGGPVWVVRAEGPFGDERHPALAATADAPADCPTVALDLVLVPVVSPAAARALRRTAAELSARGRRVYVTGPSAASEAVLRVPGGDDDRLRIVPTLAQAVAEVAGAAGGAGDGGRGDAARGNPGSVPVAQTLRRAAHACAQAAAATAPDSADTVPGTARAARGGAAPETADTAATGLPPAAAVRTPTAPPASAGGAPTAPPAAAKDAASDDTAEELSRLRSQVRHLSGRVRSHPLIDRAQGVVQGRYGLPAGDTAFELLRAVSQRHNVKLRLLASAVVLTTPPEGAGPWFPGRARRAAPTLAFLPGERPERASQTAVVNALLARAMEVTRAPMGDVRLVDPCSGELRIEADRGLPDGFTEDFAHLRQDEGGGATVWAARRGVRVTMTDAARDPALGERARALLRAAGGRGSHATPLPGPGARTHGVVTTLFDVPVQPLDARAARVLDRLASSAGAWLTWYYATIVLDALEELHARAVAAAGRIGASGPLASRPY